MCMAVRFEKPRNRQPRARQRLLEETLVDAGSRRGRRISGKPERLRRSRREDNGTVADGDDAIEWPRPRRLDDRRQRRVLFMEANRDGFIAPRIVELMTPIRRKHQLNPGALCCVAKRAKLITGRGGEDENAQRKISN